MREARRDRRRRASLFYDGGTSEALERLLITARLRRAIEQDELVLHFQPIFRLPDGSVAARRGARCAGRTPSAGSSRRSSSSPSPSTPG